MSSSPPSPAPGGWAATPAAWPRWATTQLEAQGRPPIQIAATPCRHVADRLQVGTALLHLGCVRFPITGPVRYSMTARKAIQLCQLVRPRTAIPVHDEGWTHFHQDRPAIEREFAQAPAVIGRSIRWLPIGEATTVAA